MRASISLQYYATATEASRLEAERRGGQLVFPEVRVGGELLPFVPVALAKIYVGISTFRRGPKSYLKGMIKAHPRRRFSKSSLFRVDIPIPSTEECPGFFEESSKSSVKRYDDRVKVPWGGMI